MAAAPGAADADEWTNAANGPGDGGPPGFVADPVPDSLSDMMSGLSVPSFVEAAFGAETR